MASLDHTTASHSEENHASMAPVHTRSPPRTVPVVAIVLVVGFLACRTPARPDVAGDAATSPADDASASPPPSALPSASVAPTAASAASAIDAGAIARPRADAPFLVASDAQFRCSSPSTPSSVKITASSQRLRVDVTGQGPCPGEVEGWKVDVREPKLGGFIRVTSHGGKPSRCLCHGEATFEIAHVPPGAYRVEVSGGFNRNVSGNVTIPP